MSYVYRNRNTGDEVSYEGRSARLDYLDNWDLISEPEPEPERSETPPEQTGNSEEENGAPGFDPGEHTVEEVNAHLADADLKERERVLQAEAEGKSRSSILTGPYSDLSGLE